MTRARHLPLITELPESRSSPVFLETASDSPVRRDSLTSSVPSMTTASEQICMPLSRSRMSSSSTSAKSISIAAPFRSTIAFGVDSSDSFSIRRFAFSSCIIPMAVFRAITKMKNRFDQACTKISAKAISTLNRLNRVQIFSRKICPVDFVIFSCWFIWCTFLSQTGFISSCQKRTSKYFFQIKICFLPIL